MSLRSISAILLTLLLHAGDSNATSKGIGFPTSVLDIVSTFNGNYSNYDQAKAGSHAFVQARIMPVELPALGSGPWLYVEQATNGTVNILQLCSVNRGKNGLTYLTPYNFTGNARQYKYGEYNIDSLSSLTPADIHTTEGCQVVFRCIKEFVYLVNWPDCSHVINGEHPTFSITLTRDRMDVIMPAGGSIKTRPEPYKLRRIGERFPVKGALVNYVRPSEKKDDDDDGDN